MGDRVNDNPPGLPRYVIGDATRPQGGGPKIIAHICNDLGRWGAGFVLAVSARWLDPVEAYREWHHNRADDETHPFALGEVQLVEVDADLWVANMIGQQGVRTNSNPVPIRYSAVVHCLKKLAVYAKDLAATVHMPRIGCGLAGGTWPIIAEIIKEELCDRGVPVTVYDLDAQAARKYTKSANTETRR